MEYDKNVCPVIDVDGVIASGKQFDLEIKLPEDNRNVIYGVVKDCYGDPICDAVVKLIEVICNCGKDERRPVSHTFTDKEGEFVFGPLCENRFYEIQIWVDNVRHCKICTEAKREGKCLKGVKLDCKHDYKYDCKPDYKDECKCDFKKDYKDECKCDFKKDYKEEDKCNYKDDYKDEKKCDYKDDYKDEKKCDYKDDYKDEKKCDYKDDCKDEKKCDFKDDCKCELKNECKDECKNNCKCNCRKECMCGKPCCKNECKKY